jgi:DNA-directed RNA polymerase beta subunit
LQLLQHSIAHLSSDILLLLLLLLRLLQGITYKGPLTMDLCWEADNSGAGRQSISRRMGALPIMVKSSACYLKGMSRQQLVAAKEESTEFGGYFICNGIERIIRMLILQVCAGPRAGQVS